MTVKGPGPKIASGYYVFVGNGTMKYDGEELPLWSMVVVEYNEDEFEIHAGGNGLEAMVLQFPLSEHQDPIK